MSEDLASSERLIAQTISIHRKSMGDESEGDSWFLAADIAIGRETFPEIVVDNELAERVAQVAEKLWRMKEGDSA